MRRALAAAACALAVVAAACGDDDGDQATQPAPTATGTQAETSPEEDARRLARSKGEPEVSTYASGLEVPWDMVFLPDGSALITERPGRVRLISPSGKLRAAPAATVPVSALGEGGLLGIALDPDFARNDFVYLYYTTADGMKVTRYRYRRGRLAEEATVLDGVQAGAIHDSGRIHFGPDKRLYVATGDAGQPDLAQDRGSRNGKFLRLDPLQYRGDGPARPDVFTLGHRNPQGFDWQPRSERLVATEHGDTGNDEVNVLRQGRNYGWPDAEGGDHGGFTGPVALYEQTIAPSGATFVSLPGSAWTGDYVLAALLGEQLRKLSFEGGRVTRNGPLFEGEFGRMRTVVEGPDGALYALTSNRDGRGSPRAGDDRIVRIVPPAG